MPTGKGKQKVTLGIVSNFVFNMKQIQANWLISIPPETIKKHAVFWWFQGGKKLKKSPKFVEY